MTDLFHITHIRNLPGIIESGGLWCDKLRAVHASNSVCIGHRHIKDRRSRRAVQRADGTNVAAGGFLCDYVPFYFAPRSPMLYAIDRGYVEGYQEGQRPILHLVTTVEAAIGVGRKFAFTDGHAEMVFSEFYETLDALPTCVDWEVMRLAYWHDTDENPDRKRRRQAEFLVHEFFPWEAIIRIGVKDLNVRRDVELALLKAGHRPQVVINLNWYY